MKGADYSYSHPSTSALKAAGIQFVMRYLGGSSGKDLTASEAKALSDAGIKIGSNFEGGTTNFDKGLFQGVADANQALAQATAAGMPKGKPIYFSHDESGVSANGNAYLNGCVSVLGADAVGIYGGYDAVQSAKDHWALSYPGHHLYLWQTFAWSSGRIVSGIDIFQGKQITIGGVAVDTDTAYTDAGLWTVGGAPPPGGDGDLDATQAQQLADLHDAILGGSGGVSKQGSDKVGANGHFETGMRRRAQNAFSGGTYPVPTDIYELAGWMVVESALASPPAP